MKRFKVLFDVIDVKQDIEAFSKSYLDFISEASFIIEGAEEVISALYREYKLAVVTNGIYSTQYKRLRDSPLKNYFDVFVASERIGIAKPDPDFFRFVFKESAHSNKHTAIIVGDSLLSDIKGGLNFGIDTCWFNPGKVINEEEIEPTYEIEELVQIKDIIASSHNF